MIFDEKSQKLPHTGSGRISVTASDRHIGPPLKWSILDDFFYEKSQKSPQAGSGRISATASDRPVRPKCKRSIFDDF
jgi:hypothetical protein